MKTLILFLTLFIICISTFTLAQPKIQFDTTIYDFGSVVESNESFKAKFWFTNIGTEPLVIGRVQTSGGGLASGGWPKEPVLPGKRDFIILQYYGRRIGPINKRATVTSNALNDNGTIRQIDNFQDGHLIHSIMYDIPYNGDETECLYKNDLIMERKTTKNIDKQE